MLAGDEAWRTGLLSRLVPDDQIAAEARKIAETLAAGPPGAYRRIKRLLAEAEHNRLDEHLEREAEAIAASADSPAGRAGVDAFAARRRS